MENKNTIIALILMLIVWTGFTYIFPPEQVVGDVADDSVQVKQTETIVKTVPAVVSSVVYDEINNNIEKEITLENDYFIAVFSTKGAALVDYRLKNYKEDAAVDAGLVSMLSANDNVNSLVMSGTDDFSISENIVFDTTSADVVQVDNDYSLIFKVVTPQGLSITKTFEVSAADYVINFNAQVENISPEQVFGSVGFALNTAWDESMKGDRLEFVGPVSYADESLVTVDVDDLDEASVSYKGNALWSGFESKYFISTVISNDLNNVNIAKKNNIISNVFSSDNLTLAAGENYIVNGKVFYGPKDVKILQSVGDNLSEAVDFGFFKLLAKPLHLVLNFFYSYLGNYGYSIIILTIILKLLFWPLTQKSYVSMKAMQTLQPEMKKLREKYSKDKESLNRKMMELYKEHRVNPLGGCLPMLVQIPVFFALYKVLLDTIELRHAPFAFWLTDLSVKDPYYITPIIMGATMFIQQKLTPNTMDPMQAKMMLAMPVVFTFLFLNFPSGLVVYWLVNNLLTIFQQYRIYKKPA